MMMIENFNHNLFTLMAARPNLSGPSLLAAEMLAEWAITAGPALLILLWLFGETPDRRAVVGASLAALLGLAIAGAISSLFFQPRPFMDGPAHNFLHHAHDSSFPSDHATLLFALGFAMLLAPPALIRRLSLVPLGLACAVGWALIYLGAHYPLDIAGAALIGFVSAGALASHAGRTTSNALTTLGERLYASPLSVTRFRRH